jgi:hypothetical protein
VIVTGSFLYVPFILRASTIVEFFVRITSVFVTPLMTVYLMGVLTHVHRGSAVAGLTIGSAYGLSAATLGGDADHPGILPFWFTERFAAYIWSTGITAAAMLIASLVPARCKTMEITREPSAGWLAHSHERLPELAESPFRQGKIPWWASPNLWAAVTLGTSAMVIFGVLW